jgi:hypothetical protein
MTAQQVLALLALFARLQDTIAVLELEVAKLTATNAELEKLRPPPAEPA